ncbi:MAG: NHL repeat-containing protein [Deltaproteobacteria bacterium]|nr:MAG: NHL repeat-containing protein [Deltaproteobacteria bacterium]
MTKALVKIFGMIAVTLVSVLLLLIPFSGAAIKFKYITSIYADAQGVPLKQPEGVACNDQSHLVVADTGNGRLLKYVLKDGTVETGTVEIKIAQLSYPIKAELNSKGDVYALDRRKRRILRFTPEGTFKDYVEPVGLTSPAEYVPRSFTIDREDKIYILDILSERVLTLSPEGRYLRHLKFPQEYGFFSDIAVDYKGTVFIVDSVKGIVHSAAKLSTGFSPITKSLKEYVRFPASLTSDNRGRMYLMDKNGGSMIILGQDGSFLGRQSSMGWKEGWLNYPAQICINDKGEIFVADTNNSRVQIFSVVE